MGRSATNEQHVKMWEYCVLQSLSAITARNFIILFTLDGYSSQTLDGGQKGFAKAVAQLGLDGWELVCVSGTLWYGESYHYFRREVARP